MKLQLIPVRYKNVLDSDTYVDYITFNGENVIKANRELFSDTWDAKELIFDGFYFLYHEHNYDGKEFATLQPYRLNTSPLSKRHYSFGCINEEENRIYMFFKGKRMASDRDAAMTVYGELKSYCASIGHLTPFSIKY